MIQQYFLNDFFCISPLRCRGNSINFWPSEDISGIMWNKVVQEEGGHRNSQPHLRLLGGLQPSLWAFSWCLALCSGPCWALGHSGISRCQLESESALAHATPSSISTPTNNPGHSVAQRAGMGASLLLTPMFTCPWVSHFLSPGFTFPLARYRELSYQKSAHFFYKGPENKYFRLRSPHIWVCNNSNLALQHENAHRQSAKECV